MCPSLHSGPGRPNPFRPSSSKASPSPSFRSIAFVSSLLFLFFFSIIHISHATAPTPDFITDFQWDIRTNYSAVPYNLYLVEDAAIFNVNFSFDYSYHALRLTPSRPQKRGAIWTTELRPVKYGFEINFRFRLSQDHALRRVCQDCFDRTTDSLLGYQQNVEGNIVNGGDGFAFVLQAKNGTTEMPYVGLYGANMGYGGLNNSIAVEFDTCANPELLDPYAGHVSINTRGTEYNSPSHETFGRTKTAPAYGSIIDLYNDTSGDALKHVWNSPISPVNYIYPNVTPPYNYGPMHVAFDSKEHTAKITYAPQDQSLMKVYVDGALVNSASFNLSGVMDLQPHPQCRLIYGCVGPRDMRDPITNIKYATILTCTVHGNDRLWSDDFSVVRKPRGVLRPCRVCSFRDRCASFVGLTSATGTVFENHDILYWDYKFYNYTGKNTTWTSLYRNNNFEYSGQFDVDFLDVLNV